MKTENLIIYNKEFDEKFRYDGKDLGAICTKEGTVFKVWCPLADRVELNIFEGPDKDGYAVHELVAGEKGTWSLSFEDSLHGTYYDYTVYRGEDVTRTADPYAIACGVNGIRSMVVDLSLTNPDGFLEEKAPAKENETIIYELHIKDFSYDENSGVPAEYRGKYKAFTVKDTNGKYPTCMEHLKKLGVTHVHLLPMYDYGWLDEAGDDTQFNWGYDPVNYNVPEGSFSTNPYDGAVRIKECKEMIQALHENGIRVVMDVVYNHTYEPDCFLERMVPGYYDRRFEDGSLANGSACGSDIACGRAMVDNYIADSVMYWAKEYHFDGFRFDLMGLLTVELMNRIRKELDAEFGVGEKILYGEPWTADVSPMEEGTTPALKVNVDKLDDGVAIFSDDTRDVIKGHVFYVEEPGFVNGAGEEFAEKTLDMATGWCGLDNDEFKPKSCNQIINYISAHDNFTLWDKLAISMHGELDEDGKFKLEEAPVELYTTKYEDVLEANKLGAFMYFTAQGHLFMQAGEEFGRTKFGDENSYRSDPKINMLRWEQTIEFADLLAYYEGLISLRKKLPGLCDKSADAPKRITEKQVQSAGVASFVVDNTVDGKTENWSELVIAYNSNNEQAAISIPEGEWVVLADKYDTDCEKEIALNDDKKLIVESKSGIMLGKK